MKNFIVIIFISLLSTNILYANSFNVLYLNSGSGNFKIENEILDGIKKNIYESNNITLYIENLSLYNNYNYKYLNQMIEVIENKYSAVTFDLVIILNSHGLDFIKRVEMLKGIPIVYGDILYNGNSSDIDKNLEYSTLYIHYNVNDLIKIIKKHNVEQNIKYVQNSWELMDSNELEVINYKDIDPRDIDTIYIYSPFVNYNYLNHIVNTKVYGYWDYLLNYKLAGGILYNTTNFGYSLSNIGKKIMLKIESKHSRNLYKEKNVIIDFKRQNNISPDTLLANITYINRPKSKLEIDKTLIWKLSLVILISIFTIFILIFIYISNKKRSILIIESQQQLYSLINSLPLPIHARDLDGKYLFVNDMFLKTNHIDSRDEIINRTINNTPGLSPEEVTKFLKQDREVIYENRTKIYESSFYDVKAKINRLYKVYKNPFVYYGINSVLCILDDITDLKTAEREVIELNRSLEQKIEKRTNDLKASLDELKTTQNELYETRRMASLSTLVVGIAHEMNTPLGIALTQTTYNKDISSKLKHSFNFDNIKKSELKEYIYNIMESEELILTSINRAIKMIKRFKEISLQKNDKAVSFNLLNVLKERLYVFLVSQDKTSLEIEYEIEKDLEVTTFNNALIKVLENIIHNSIIHGELGDHGKIKISAKYIDSNNIEIIYSDNGIGIDNSVVSQIFDPFYTTKRSEGQIGFGLSIVYAIIKNILKGNIEYFLPESGKGVGYNIVIPNFKN